MPNVEVCPESFGAMLECYVYIKHDLQYCLQSYVYREA